MDTNCFKNKVGSFFLQRGSGVLQILIKTYKNTPNLKSKSERRKVLLILKATGSVLAAEF